MVESIYGGKAPVSSDPFTCYEANAFHPRFVADRRLSIQCSHLRPISELGDESTSFSTSDARQRNAEIATALNDVHTVYGRSRTMSLPTIYRDGSYLRIKRPSSTSCKAHGRRFSEPGARARQPSLHHQSFTPASHHEVAPSTGNKDDSLVKYLETPLQAHLNNSATPRRHSDPMIYVTDNLERLRISEKAATNEKTRHNQRENNFDSLKPLPPSNIDAGEVSPSSTTTRRRKWSLVPVPFKMVQNQQRASHYQQARRPLSFPPRKIDSFKQYNLHQATTFSNGKSPTRNAAMDSNNNHEPSLDKRVASETSDALTETYVNEDILSQWMKFFG